MISESQKLLRERSPKLKSRSCVGMLKRHLTRVEREVTSTHRAREEIQWAFTPVFKITYDRSAERALVEYEQGR